MVVPVESRDGFPFFSFSFSFFFLSLFFFGQPRSVPDRISGNKCPLHPVYTDKLAGKESREGGKWASEGEKRLEWMETQTAPSCSVARRALFPHVRYRNHLIRKKCTFRRRSGRNLRPTVLKYRSMKGSRRVIYNVVSKNTDIKSRIKVAVILK